MSEILGRVFNGYRLLRHVSTTDHEEVFLVERVRDGEEMWLRTIHPNLDPSVVAFYSARYESELEAGRRLASSGGIVHLRGIIELCDADGLGDDRPALVMDIPMGQPLDTLLAESLNPRKMKDVLRWFRRLVGAVESAHAEGLGHGRLQARDVFVSDNRAFVLGFTSPAADDTILANPDEAPIGLAELHRRDVHSLATILYHATTGRPPVAGFPFTGQPAAPHEFLDNYPESLSRFLLHRLAPDGEDPVADAAVFRKALESLAVDPEFRRAAAFNPDDDHPMVAEARRERWWRKAMGTVITAAAAASIAGTLTFGVARVRIGSLERRVSQLTEMARVAQLPTASAPVQAERSDAWACIHSQFQSGGDGHLELAEAHRCAAMVPGLTVDELSDELDAIRSGFVATTPAPNNDLTFMRLFRLGPDEVESHVRYRLQSGLPTEALDNWVARHLDSSVPVLRSLEARGGAVGAWARVRLEPVAIPAGGSGVGRPSAGDAAFGAF